MTLKEKQLRLLDRMFDAFENEDFRMTVLPLLIGCMDEDEQYEHNQFMMLPPDEKKEVLQYELKAIEESAIEEVKIIGKHLKSRHPEIFKKESELFVLQNKDLTIFDWLTFLWRTYEKHGLYKELIQIICSDL